MVPVMKRKKTTVHTEEVCLQRTGRMINSYTIQFCMYTSCRWLDKETEPALLYITITEQWKISVKLIKYLHVDIAVNKDVVIGFF